MSTLGSSQRPVLGQTPPSSRWVFLVVSGAFISFSAEQKYTDANEAETEKRPPNHNHKEETEAAP